MSGRVAMRTGPEEATRWPEPAIVATALMVAEQNRLTAASLVPCTILVADTDSSSRKLLCSILRHEGYAVLEAACVEDVAPTLAEGQVDLLFADVGLGGAEDEAVAASRCDLSHLGVSRTTTTGGRCVLRMMREPKIAVLHKPFSARQLVDGVAALLESPPTWAGLKTRSTDDRSIKTAVVEAGLPDPA